MIPASDLNIRDTFIILEPQEGEGKESEELHVKRIDYPNQWIYAKGDDPTAELIRIPFTRGVFKIIP